MTALGERYGIVSHDVVAYLEDTLPGGTANLTFQFGLRDERVASLRILPTEEVKT